MEVWKHGKTRLVMGPPEGTKYRLQLYSFESNKLVATYRVESKEAAYDLVYNHIFGGQPKALKKGRKHGKKRKK